MIFMTLLFVQFFVISFKWEEVLILIVIILVNFNKYPVIISFVRLQIFFKCAVTFNVKMSNFLKNPFSLLLQTVNNKNYVSLGIIEMTSTNNFTLPSLLILTIK